MANEPKKTTEAPPPAEPAAALPPVGGSGTSNPAQRFVEAYERYAQAVQAASDDSGKRIQEAAQKLFEEQQDACARAMSPEAPASGAVWDPVPAQQRFLREQQEAWTEAQRRYEEAYLKYLDRLREAWPPGSSPQLDPEGLLTIGQSLQAAACLAQSTMGAWNVVGHWVTQPPSGAAKAA